MQRLALLVAVALLALFAGQQLSVSARANAPDWEPTALTGDVSRLFPTTSGTLYAHGGENLFRTDDDGVNWFTIPLPPRSSTRSTGEPRRVAVAPDTGTVLFTDGEQGLYRSADAGQTWLPVTLPPDVGEWVESVAVSPADPAVVYLAMVPSPYQNRLVWLLSSDSGATWAIMTRAPRGPCTYRVFFFWPHPQYANRAYSSWDCSPPESGRIFSKTMSHSVDYGASWSLVTSFQNPVMGVPVALAGGQGVTPNRFYLVSHAGVNEIGQRAWRSETGLGNWSKMFEMAYITPTALAYHPDTPDHVYMGVVGTSGVTAPGDVLQSKDAGATWERLGQQSIGAVRDLYLTPDGQQLYAATNQGVYRIAVTP